MTYFDVRISNETKIRVSAETAWHAMRIVAAKGHVAIVAERAITA